jgi:hypothetical protein
MVTARRTTIIFLLFCVAGCSCSALAQHCPAPCFTAGSGIWGFDILGGHQNAGRGCAGCHAPHSGARANGGNVAAGGGPVSDRDPGGYLLWAQDVGPLYGQAIATGHDGAFDVVLPPDSTTLKRVTTGVMMCLSCHDGNLAKGAMMASQSFEQSAGMLPPNSYGQNPVPTLLGSDGSAPGNYRNDHPIGPKANAGALGLTTGANPRVVLAPPGTCTAHGMPIDCLQPNPANEQYIRFIDHYGSYSVTQATAAYPAGAHEQPLVMPDQNPDNAYVVCTTCHNPHSMYIFSGTAGGLKGVFPSYFFIAAPYNPAAPIPIGTRASSATQFCRQCHFSGAGGANEAVGILNVRTQF